MKFKSIILMAASAAALFTVAGCGKPANSVEFYLDKKNDDAHTDTLRRCMTIPYDKRYNDQDCKNARDAVAIRSAR